ncbi:MAG: hypothetical protein KME64_17665 [Scytonematopsis contorta HA4267-MV1]|jgi:hypothetical protein|nr:hypothetical protein [Scytonematopsis contorta HA4267-MV1]
MIIPIFAANPYEKLNFTTLASHLDTQDHNRHNCSDIIFINSTHNRQRSICRVRSLIPNLNILPLLVKRDYSVNRSGVR